MNDYQSSINVSYLASFSNEMVYTNYFHLHDFNHAFSIEKKISFMVLIENHAHFLMCDATQVGKAHFELVDYFEAERSFCLARTLSPYMLEGMDIYSTVLYVRNLMSISNS